jgi:H+/Cl- antiporter ClcA
MDFIKLFKNYSFQNGSKDLKTHLLIIPLSLIIGVNCTIFLYSLDYVTALFQSYQSLLFLMPLVGIFIVFQYQRYGQAYERGNDVIYESIKDPSLPKLSLIKSILIYFTTLLTHLVGGSAGREGTALQISAPFADLLTGKFNIGTSGRKLLMICACAGGFGAVFGTPWAAGIFSIEVSKQVKLSFRYLLPTLLCAHLSNGVGILLKAPHTDYPVEFFNEVNLKISISLIAFAISIALLSKSYQWINDHFKSLAGRLMKSHYYRIGLGSLFLIFLFLIEGSGRYYGLGIPYIQEAFQTHANTNDFLLKSLFTIFTLGIGFKGGEATPLFFIGASFGSFLSVYFGLPVDFLAALGFVALFGIFTKTPIASAIMAMELFGMWILPYALLICGIGALIYNGLLQKEV